MLFGNYHFISAYVDMMLRNYTYLNSGLTINLTGKSSILKMVCSICLKKTWIVKAYTRLFI